MTTGAIVVLVAAVIVLCATAVQVACILALLWSYSKLRPIEDFQAVLSGLRAMVDNLESQIVKLRTQKAAKNSPRTQPREEPQDHRDDNPLLEGLDDDTRAYFQ